MANRFNPNPDFSQEYVDPSFVIKPTIKPVQEQEKFRKQQELNARFLQAQERRKRQEDEYKKYLESRYDVVKQQKQFEPPKLTQKQKELKDEFLYKVKTREEQAKECPVCLDNDADKQLACGHKVCEKCSELLKSCPICRKEIMKMSDDVFCVVM